MATWLNMQPVVTALWDDGLKPLSQPERIDLLGQKGISITQALKDEDVPVNDDMMIGF